MPRFDVIVTQVAIERQEQHWHVFYLGNDGKRRLAGDILIPDDVPEDALGAYLDDLRHEHATPQRPRVHRVEWRKLAVYPHRVSRQNPV